MEPPSVTEPHVSSVLQWNSCGLRPGVFRRVDSGWGQTTNLSLSTNTGGKGVILPEVLTLLGSRLLPGTTIDESVGFQPGP